MPLWHKLIVVLGMFWLTTVSLHAATDVGTAIVNQATLTYVDDVTGHSIELKSNTSTILVAPLQRFELFSSQNLLVTAGQSVSLSHSLSNVGNVDDRYLISVENQLADSGDLINLMLYIDANDNGVVDAGEKIVSGETGVSAGESVSLVVTGIVPAELNGNDEIELVVYAEAIESELPVQTNTDLITVEPSAKLQIELTSSHSCDAAVSSGERIDFQLSAVNTSSTVPQERAVIIDGALKEGVLLEASLPKELTLVAGEFLDVFAYQAIPIVQENIGSNAWMRYEHWTGSTVLHKIGLLIPASEFAENDIVGMSFGTTSNESSVNVESYLAASIDLDADNTADVEAAPVCFTSVGLSQAIQTEIRFLEPNLELQRGESVPQFDRDSDFIDAPVYQLNKTVLGGLGTESESGPSGIVDDARNVYRLAINGVYLELRADVPQSQQIAGASGSQFVVVNVVSSLTGDTLQVLLKETEVASNVYRSLSPILLSDQLTGDGAFCPGGSNGALPADANYEPTDDVCTLKSDVDDTLTVTFVNEASQEVVSDTAVVEPLSRVFDSTSLSGVAGATVSFVIGEQVQLHPISGKPLQFVTDEDGRYVAPRLTPNTGYAISVQPPETHQFPSTVAPEQFAAFSVSAVSYGASGFAQQGVGTFSVEPGDNPPVIDIPLDPANRNALLIAEKKVATGTVEIGDVALYTITVKNQSGGDLTDVAIIDYPAYGFRYIPGTATFNDQSIADPQTLSMPANTLNGAVDDGSTVNGLRFIVTDMAALSEGTLRYQMRTTAGALEGSGVNRANANATTVSGLVLSTPTSEAQVHIQQSGVLSDQATLFGKVYVDSSCDNLQNRGEWPIGGVRLYLHDGTFVITDEDGQFSLFGLPPGLHVLKIDELTLPEGLQLKPIDNRQAADPQSRFVELSAGDFHRADFATYCPQQHAESVFKELEKRNLDLRNAWTLDEAAQYDPDANAPQLDLRKRADTDGDLSQGMLGFQRSFDQNSRAVVSRSDANEATLNTEETASGGTVLTARDEEPVKMGDPEELVKSITTDQAKAGTWLWPKNDLSWDGRFMAVIPAGVDPVLYVNDQAVSASQIGEQIVNRRASAQLVAWYGVRLVPGPNTVEVRGKDAFGNERVMAKATFRRPSAGVRLALRTKQDTLEADGGRSRLPIDIVITDAHNNPANGVYFVTLSSSGGAFLEDDLQSREPGMQVRVENGRGRVHLLSTELTGNVQIQANTGALAASLNVVQIAAARPLIGAGLIDVGGQWNSVRNGTDTRANLEDGFKTDERIALFLKGKIKNDLHLTMSYDSDKNKQVNVLRDFNPNEHYSTYGDASLRGVEAQSRSKLYLKVEKNKNSVMWGDYLTDNNAEVDDLGRVQRTLTGANLVLANSSTRFQLFAADVSSSRESEEIAGNGTSMLFQLSRAPLVINSELVERIVRDRNNPGLVIESQTLQRYSDYSIDFSTGVLQFADVIPTVDSDLNPVFIRISYDLSSAQNDYLVSGARFSHKFNQWLSAGASITDDQNPLSGYTLSSVNGIAHLSRNTRLSATAATQQHRDGRADGRAQRVHIEHAWHGQRDYRTEMTWARASSTFDNPSAGISAAREEWRLEHRQPIGNSVKAIADASHSESLSDSSSTSSASLLFEKTFSTWSAKLGAKTIRSEEAAEQGETLSFNTVLVGLEKRFTFGDAKRGSIGVDYERDMANSRRNRLGISARLQLHKHLSSYARFESERGLSFQSYGLSGQRNDTFTAGLESDILPSTKLYSEYRMRGSHTGRSMETATGIRGRYDIRPGLTVSPAFELIDVMRGNTTQDSIAASLGISDTRNPNRKLTAQAEVRETTDSRYYGFRAAAAQRLNVDWTGLVREEFTRQTPDIGELTSRHRFTLGLARRPKRDNTQHGLFMADWKIDFGPEEGMDRTTYMLSTHQNRQIAPNATLSGRFGSRWTKTQFNTGAIRSNVVMSDLRATFDLDRRWELDLRGGWLGAGGIGDGRYSFGAGLSWIARRNLRLGVRYNVIGFREDDLDEQGFNQQGVRIGLQAKFDEDWFRWLE